MDWRHNGPPHHKRFKLQKSSKKLFASIFWDQNGTILIDYFPKGQIINAKHYSSLLVQLKYILKKKRRGNFTKGSCSCTTMPRLTGHSQPTRNWATWASNALITDLFSGSRPVGLLPVPWSEKTVER
jgi:hypothetical protein